MTGIDEIIQELEKYEYTAEPGLIEWLKGRIIETDIEAVFDRFS
jgi:hypothetical protein